VIDPHAQAHPVRVDHAASHANSHFRNRDVTRQMETEQVDTGRLDDVDPDIRAFHQATSAAYADLSAGGYADIAARRAVAERVRAPWRSGGPLMARTDDLRVGADGVRIRIHRPTDDPALPVLVYIHGGGWVLFSIDTHDRLMREYAARAGCAVIGVDYSLAPEARFPRPLDEVGQVLDWLRAEGAGQGLDTDRVAIGGDSAGANLSIATALRLRDAGRADLKALLLNYGAFDNVIRPSHDRYDGDDYMLTTAEMMDFWSDYLGGPIDVADPLARPLLAGLHGLPPAFLCIAACDILVDENHEMAHRLAEAGNAVCAVTYAGATHSFLEAMSISPLARRAIDDAAGWLRTHFA
jgi:acetyl esterase